METFQPTYEDLELKLANLGLNRENFRVLTRGKQESSRIHVREATRD